MSGPVTVSGPSCAAEERGRRPSAENSTRFLILADEDGPLPSRPRTSSCSGACARARALPGFERRTGPPAALGLEQ